MRFEARELPPYIEHVPVDQLQYGHVYFIVSFMDDEMLVPELKPVIFVGRDLEQEDRGKLYFQDYESYMDGVRYHGATDGAERSAGSEYVEFECFFETESSGVCEYDRALDELLRCSLQRRG